MARLALRLAAALSLAAGAALAQDESPLVAISPGEALREGTLLLQVRPRYTWVEQDGRPDDAYWASVRTTLGWQTLEYKGWSAVAELVDVTRFAEDNALDYSDSPANSASWSGWSWWSGMGYAAGYYPLLQDPDDTDVNRLYVDYSAYWHTSIRAGRQLVRIDNQRFIGDYDYGQMPQAFDGLTLDSAALPGLRLLYGYYAQVRNAYAVTRDTSLNAANVHYEFGAPLKLAAYGYFQNQPQTGSVTGFADNSNKIYGARAWGAWRVAGKADLLYSAEVAEQRDFAGGDPRIDASYLRLGGGIHAGRVYGRVDWERLGSNDGLYGFQTPLGSTQLFTGRADVFATTPRVGLEDLRGMLGLDWGRLRARLEYHSFRSDQWDWDLGSEVDVGITWRFTPRLSVSVDYADYQAGDPAAGLWDTRKAWVTVDFRL
jgi:hypothetical protein